MAQVCRLLQEAFHVTEDTMAAVTTIVQDRPAPEVTLHLNVKQAKDLRPKTVKGSANTYALVGVSGVSHTQRTRLERGTLSPKWNHNFVLPVKNVQKDSVTVEIWHEHDAVNVKQLTAVRDIRGLGRLVKGTTAHAHQQPKHLLGCITINIKDVSQRGVVDEWCSLEKKVEGDMSMEKDRGSVHLVASVTSSSAQLDIKDRHTFDALLARLVHHHLTAITNNNSNNTEGDWTKPWRGQVSGPAAAALAQYAITLDLSDAAVRLSWWRVGTQVTNADPAWILSQLHHVQAALGKGAYKGEVLQELQESLAGFVSSMVERLKELHTFYPVDSGVLTQHHLSSTLKTLQAMQSHTPTRQLLDHENIPDLKELVTSSLTMHTKNWWRMAIEQLHGVKTSDQQINKVIDIVADAHTLLTQVADFYNPIFMKEMNVMYMQTAYLSISNKINPCVRPLVMNIYNRLPTIGTQDIEGTDDGIYAMQVGTALWQLYRNVGRLHRLGEHLPPDLRCESGVCEYHRWFSRGVMRWLELAVCRAQSMIRRAVELDSLEPISSFCNFSSSATDTIGIFNEVKNWWVKLAWPDLENSAVLLAKILEDVSSCGTKYCDLLREKVQSMFHQETSSKVFITKQICIGLNSIDHVRKELTSLPDLFKFNEILEELRRNHGSRGVEAAGQLEATVERLIFSSVENMETKVNEFVETVIGKMQSTLEGPLTEACESQSTLPLLDDVLDPTLQLLHSLLNESNFRHFIWRTWEVLLDLFDILIKRNAERRKANYFSGVYKILEASLKFFTPKEGMGLDRKTAQTPEYLTLVELLENLKMTTEALITKYYQERYDEQVEEVLPSKAQLVIKVLFTRTGKLQVEVIMARDMVVEGDTTSIGSSQRGLLHNQHHGPVDSYVKVQMVPAEWFPTASIRKTKTLRKKDPAVYNETFEFEMSQGDDGVSGGFLLLTLKDYNLGRTNTFIGEAVVPLASLPCVDSSLIHTIPNTYMKMTTPGLDFGYKSLRALHLRTGDRIATSFLKKVSKRLIDSTVKQSPNLRPDDGKARSKSPVFKDRLQFS